MITLGIPSSCSRIAGQEGKREAWMNSASGAGFKKVKDKVVQEGRGIKGLSHP